MKYADMHCDTLTVCSDRGLSLADGNLQVNLEKLKKSGCAVQCFAIFTQGGDAALRFEKYLAFYRESFKKHGVKRVLDYSDLESCLNGEEVGGILTVENPGVLCDLSKLSALHSEGVRMASLVWN